MKIEVLKHEPLPSRYLEIVEKLKTHTEGYADIEVAHVLFLNEEHRDLENVLEKFQTPCDSESLYIVFFEKIKVDQLILKLRKLNHKVMFMNLQSEKLFESLSFAHDTFTQKNHNYEEIQLFESKDCYQTITHWLKKHSDVINEKAARFSEFVLVELILNAFFNAPVDHEGNRLYTHMDRRENIQLDKDKAIQFQYSIQSENLILKVIDHYGSLEKETFFNYLQKCLRRDQDQIDTKEGGAGLGLYMILKKCCHYHVYVSKNEKTIFTCSIPLKSRNKNPKPGCLSFFQRTES